MPEEKVSHATTVTQCPKFQWCVMGHSHEGECSSTHYVLAPAADAGPRQPEPCGEPAASFIPRWGMYFTCVLPKGHKGEHKQGGTCYMDGTSPEKPFNAENIAALIREAGSHERKHPPSNELLWKITRELPEQLQPMYCSMTPVPLEEIRSLISSALQDVANDEYAQAYEFFSRAGVAGSERERELREYCLKRAAENAKRAAGDDDPRWFAAKADTYRRIASRLLGGESK